MKTRHDRYGTAAGLVLAWVTLGCHAQESTFCTSTYACDITAQSDQCGTTCDGRPMTCFPATPLGGQDFCAPACDMLSPPQGEEVCVGSRGMLTTCQPAASESDPAVGCPSGLACYRTDLVRDEGLCLDMPVCSVNQDCPDANRPICASTLLSTLYPQTLLRGDHLYCLHAGCSSGSPCPSGESCMPDALPDSGSPDICIPNCDADLHCPVNFACARAVSGPVAPKVCVPGLPGLRCAGSQDCMLGDCMDTGLGFGICSIPCSSDEDCVPLISTRDVFVCLPTPTGTGGYCAATGPFSGQPCQLSEDCPAGQDCFTYGPYVPLTVGECRPPCGASGECSPLGGLPLVCLMSGAGGCYPGRLGLPCTETSQCIADFSCLLVLNDLAAGGAQTEQVCTISCSSDADCNANPWTNNDGYCGNGFCQLGGAPGGPCQRDAQCRTGRCQLPPTGMGQCLPEPLQ